MGLYDYFKQQGQALPSIEQRRQTYGLGAGYTGTAAQNIALLQRLQGGGGQRAPTPVAQAPAQGQAQGQAQGSLLAQYQSRLAPITAQSDKLLKEYYALAAQAPSFATKLLDAIKKSEQYPSQAAMREEYAKNPNLTPMAVESLVSRRGASTRGTIQDIINRATGGFQSDIASRRGMAEMAQQQRANLLEEYGLAQQSQQTALDRIRQMEQDLMAKEKWEWQKERGGAGGGTDLSWIADLLSRGGEQQFYQPTEPKPTRTPPREGVQTRSPKGQWLWDWETRDWYPIVD